MPTNTDLVKDLPADFDVFGQAVDDRIKALNPETTAGDIAYRASTANAKSRLAIGTAGQVLTVNSGATAPEWATPSAGGMTLISETVASAISSLSLTSISGSYKQLLLIWGGIRHSGTGSGFDIRLNNNSGSVYAVQITGAVGNTLSTQGDIRTSISGCDWRAFGLNANAGDLRLDAGGFLLIDNYASSTKAKSFNGAWNFFDNTSGNWRTSNSVTGIFNSTTAVTSIDIFRTTGSATFSNTTDTTIRLYGVA